MDTEIIRRVQRLRAGVREWKARVDLHEGTEDGLDEELREQLDYRLRVVDSAVERAAEATEAEAEPLLAEAEEAWSDLLIFWDRSGPTPD